MGSSLTGSRSLPTKLAIDGNLLCVAAGKHSRISVGSLTQSLKQGIASSEFTIFSGYHGCRDHDATPRSIQDSRWRYGGHCPLDLGATLSSPLSASCASPGNATIHNHDSDSESDSDSDADPDPESQLASAQAIQKMELLKQDSSPLLIPVSSQSLEPESWILSDGDVPTLVSGLPLTERYAPRRLLEFVTKKLDTQMFSLARLRSTVMFWKKKKELEEDPYFGSSAFGEWKGVSQIHQWTATELTLQHARLTRIARDILYLVLACSLLGFVRILEALLAAFSSSPPHFSRLLDAANSLDFFTMAYLAHSLRKPVVGILRVDPTNLDEVVHLKAKIWDEMHKFYERQWKLVATLGVGRLLALIAQTSPSTNTMTRNAKMCWDFLLALPIF